MRARIENGMDPNRRINFLMTTSASLGYIVDVFHKRVCAGAA